MFLTGRQQEAVLKSSCRTELWQSSDFDLQSVHFRGRQKLNPVGSMEHFSILLFFLFRVISKLCGKESLWLICRFCLFGTSLAGLGENDRSCSIVRAVMHARGGMNVCMRWDFDKEKLVRQRVDPQELVWHGYHSVHWISFYSLFSLLPYLKALLHYDVKLLIITSLHLLNIFITCWIFPLIRW